MSQVLIVDDDANTREALAAEVPVPHAAPSSSASATQSSTPAITVPLGTPLSVAARELILSTLEHCGGERKRTAEMLGICTKTLYNRLREYGIREEHHRASMGDPSRAASSGD
jgi:DNA-binding NtrC family response regulator